MTKIKNVLDEKNPDHDSSNDDDEALKNKRFMNMDIYWKLQI